MKSDQSISRMVLVIVFQKNVPSASIVENGAERGSSKRMENGGVFIENRRKRGSISTE